MHKYENISERSKYGPPLIILVGESGAGKSTFCQLLNRPDSYYSSSGAIEEKLVETGIPINHNTIHAYANKAYRNNPEWQVPNILSKLALKKILILDGPRRIGEVRALKQTYQNTTIFRIETSEQARFNRLKIRDNVDDEVFRRIVHDESKELEVEQILKMADYVINNNGDLKDLENEAADFKVLLKKIEETVYES